VLYSDNDLHPKPNTQDFTTKKLKEPDKPPNLPNESKPELEHSDSEGESSMKKSKPSQHQTQDKPLTDETAESAPNPTLRFFQIVKRLSLELQMMMVKVDSLNTAVNHIFY